MGLRPLVVGVLSDTHGQLYPAVAARLKGVDHIIHAGDIGSAEVLAGLKAIAPVTAVRGNCDLEVWAGSLPAVAEVELGGVRILVGHMGDRLQAGLERRHAGGPVLKPNGTRRGFHVVVSGHSHRASSEERGGVLYLNPGSAGPMRFGRPRTLARLLIKPREEGQAPTAGAAPAQVTVESVVVPED